MRYMQLLYRKMLYKFVRGFGNRYDITAINTIGREGKFFRVKASVIEKLLNGFKLNVIDIGARGGIEGGLKNYNHLLSITLVEPDKEAIFKKTNGINVIRKLIGEKNGKSKLNICKKGGVSSILDPNGPFLDYYTSGDASRFDVINKISIPMTTINSIIKETYNGELLDYLKLDTQGTELNILMGLGTIRPIIIKTEISFVPIYKNQTIFFHLGKVLYDMGYIMFHLSYGSKSAPLKHKKNKPYDETVVPLHGDAHFMPDWTRSLGKKIIKGRENQYEALMLMFGMKEIYKYSQRKTNG